MRPFLAVALGLFLLVLSLTATDARADDDRALRVHANLGGAHALGDPQGHEYGFGAIGQLALELPLATAIGLQVEGGGLWLSKANPPADPRIADHGAGTAGTAFAGLRVHPSAVAGFWVDVNGGFVRTGNASRAGFDAHLGYDFRIGNPETSRWDVGPFAGYLHVVQPDDTLRPEDAHIMMVGVHVALGGRPPTKPVAVRGDRDRDGVFDDEDACPDEPGIRTSDPQTNGCPRRDRDKDGIFDDEDACPDEPGIRTNDPKTNGCPRRDRDNDGVFDDEDACPDEPGVRTSDPKTNGCPRKDRDGDGVFDDEDACPDVPGVRTTDPKTNGCPPPTESVHVEKDHIVLDDAIYFETNVARVRHYSWPLVQKLAKYLNDNPQFVEVSIEGHTDEVGTEEMNKVLSKSRADAVKNLLVHFGVDAGRLTTVGWGKERPVDLGHDESAHKLNRRVEFIITRVRSGSGASTTVQTPPAATPAPPPPANGGQ